MKLFQGIVLLVIGILVGVLSTRLLGVVQYPLGSAAERISPQDHVPEHAIQVFSDRVVIKLDDPKWSRFADTNSMDPVFDQGSNAIQITPQSPGDVDIGDIVSYRAGDRMIIHRVIDKGIDEAGWFWIVKGDNNPEADPTTLRFDDITRVVVAIIY